MIFKERMLALIYQSSKSYSQLLNTEIILESNLFKYRKRYILGFSKKNFLHLTGVKTKLDQIDFFDKAFNQTLTLNDFICENNKQQAFNVRRKLVILKNIDKYFNKQLILQEHYRKGRVYCSIATSDGNCIIGFDGDTEIMFPKTILANRSIYYKNGIFNFVIIKRSVI